ncbi:MAG: hypothetical protein G01um101429_854 [Parcubacteria group bacterium Gr01-1014_29]|nr:MAG: hypothetical protein G01um101429_854 [Parcubacteria group bacterium Gr01-1014_29]
MLFFLKLWLTSIRRLFFHFVSWWLLVVVLWCVYIAKGPEWILFLDDILHFLGGGSIAVGFFLLLVPFIENKGILLWVLVASAAFTGIVWEWLHYPGEYFDTMTDLLLNPTGALVVGVYYIYFYSKR